MLAGLTNSSVSPRCQQLAGPDHRLQRRAQLMAQNGEEAGLVLGRFLRRLRRVPQLALQPFPAQDLFGEREGNAEQAIDFNGDGECGESKLRTTRFLGRSGPISLQ